MNERDEFLRDRLQPARKTAAARPPGPPAHGPHAAPRPPAPAPAPPRPSAPPQGWAPAPPSPAAAPSLRPPPAVAPQQPAPAPPPSQDLPDRGWRRVLRIATFGLITLGPSPAQRQEAQFEATIQTRLHGN